ncbi:hypothetical protein ACUODJ_49600, partial [Escherichia sp. HC-CC]
MKSTSDLFNEIIPLGRLIHMVNQKKDRLLNEYLSPLDITAAQFKVLCSIRCAACITPVELKKVLSICWDGRRSLMNPTVVVCVWP